MEVFRLDHRTGHKLRLVPRVPVNRMAFEDKETSRVVCAPTVGGCVAALDLVTGRRIYEVDPERFERLNTSRYADEYECVFNYQLYRAEVDDLYEPSRKQVPDIRATRELWSFKPITFQRVGKVKTTRTKLDHTYWTRVV